MNTLLKQILSIGLGITMTSGSLLADSFGSGGSAFSIGFVDVGNIGNAADGVGGYGKVDYAYRIGATEVSRGMIESYNSLSGGPTLTLVSLLSSGGNGVDRPATGISWNEAARFVNWLNTSSGYTEAYKFTTGGADDNIDVWASGDAGYDADNPFRNSDAHYFLPTEDEWYKAAYYDPNTSTYHDYATGSDTAPTSIVSGTASGTAVFDHASSTGPADVSDAGGLSPYGTMAQNGNVAEWVESGQNPPNDSGSEFRVFRGGRWDDSSVSLLASARGGTIPDGAFKDVGFRVAAVPEPGSALLLTLGLLPLLRRRRR